MGEIPTSTNTKTDEFEALFKVIRCINGCRHSDKPTFCGNMRSKKCGCWLEAVQEVEDIILYGKEDDK